MPTTPKKTTTAKAKAPKSTKSKATPAKNAPAKRATTTKSTPAKSAKASTPKKRKIPSAKASKSKVTQDKKSSSTVSSAKIAAKKVNKDIEPHALDDEVTEKVRQLIHLSSEQGFLTYKDVDKALPKIADKPEELQNVISIFNNLEIKLMDSKDVEKFKKK